MTTLEDIYNADVNWINQWLNYGNIKPSGNDLLDRLEVTLLIKNENELDPEDETYVDNTEFKDLYLATEEELLRLSSESSGSRIDLIREIIDDRPIDPDCQELLNLHSDITGLRIFNMFVKKGEADNPFGRERDRIAQFYTTKQLTIPDRDRLLAIINDFETIYNTFIDRIQRARVFYEKSSTNNLPRQIITAEDWAEAIFELQDTLIKFKQILDDNIRGYVNPEHLREYCDKLSYDQCLYPCSKQPSRLFRNKCEYSR